jgi:hypothetical protein
MSEEHHPFPETSKVSYFASVCLLKTFFQPSDNLCLHFTYIRQAPHDILCVSATCQQPRAVASAAVRQRPFGYPQERSFRKLLYIKAIGRHFVSRVKCYKF